MTHSDRLLYAYNHYRQYHRFSRCNSPRPAEQCIVQQIERMNTPGVKVNMVSFVVPAWNEELVLGPTLDSLHAAARAVGVDYEIVVADDASDDRTAEIARARGARVETNLRRQIAGTRNAGARAAQGDLLIFVDADTQVSAALVRATVDAVRSGAVGGGCAVEFDRVPRYARWSVPAFSLLYRKAGLAAGCYLYCTREAFEKVGGFDERFFAGEECALSAKLRWHGRFVVLPETVLTSGRKLRTYSLREYVMLFFNISVRGLPFKRENRGMEFWYGARRPDPSP